MADIVDLGEFRSEHLELRAFGPWKKRFGKSFAKETSLEDLSDEVLLFLAQPGEDGDHAIYEFRDGCSEPWFREHVSIVWKRRSSMR